MADQKLTELTETTTPVDTDLAYIVIDPGGVPTSRKMEWANALAAHDIGARVHRSATQSIGDSAWTAVAWTAEDYDTHAFHDNATNNTRMTVPAGYGGKYWIAGEAAFAAALVSQRYVRIYKNGATALSIGQGYSTNTVNVYMQTQTEVELAAGDYVELQVFQDTGGNLNVLGDTHDTWFAIRKVG